MKIAFLGTPDFALPSLKMLHERGDDVVVFTQPDKPVGRKAVMTPPPVKKAALEYGMKVYQFDKIKSEEGVAALKAEAPELMVTAAFGQILSRENLAVPKYGCINVHGSLLPKYRGAAPIQWAVINGEKITGVTTMLTDIGLDTGDILLKKETEIGENETAGELFDRLAEMGAELLKETIEALERGEVTLPMLLEQGDYTLVEVQAPEGYVKALEGKTITVGAVYNDWDDPIEVEFADMPQKGTISKNMENAP